MPRSPLALPLAVSLALTGGAPLAAHAPQGAPLQVSPKNLMPAERQIAYAVSPAPAPLRAKATVLGYSPAGRLTTLRQGTNDLICLADEPGDDEIHVACYQRDLEAFMRRGRELRAAGKDRNAIDSIRLAEAQRKVYAMPAHAAMLYSLTGPADKVTLDAATGTLTNASPLYVVYTPYATPETTGISDQPTRGTPWMMYPGKPWAHIMIIPAAPARP